MIYEYFTIINPHVDYSSVRKFTSEEEYENKKENSKETKSEEEYLSKESSENFSRVNLWSMLAGRKVKMSITKTLNPQLSMVDDFFVCYLRNKNPYYQEKYSLMFRFQDVMKDNKYTSNKFIL